MNNNNNDKNYISSFDGLRAFAIVCVVLYHFLPSIFPSSYLGVNIFLVLSGYLVTQSLIKEADNNDKIYLTDYWSRRLSRLYRPLIPFFAIIGVIILCFFQSMLKDYMCSLVSSFFGVNNIYQISRGLSYFDSHGTFNPLTHMWFLGVEIQIYILYPVIFYLLYWRVGLKKYTIARLWFFLSLVSAGIMFFMDYIGLDKSRIYYGLDTRVFAFFVGGYFAINCPSEHMKSIELSYRSAFISNIVSVIIALILFVCTIVLDINLTISYRGGMYLYSMLVGVLMILIILKENVMNKILSIKVLKYISTRSYSIYIWHYAVMTFISSYFVHSKMSKVYIVMLEFILSISLAEISYRLFEKREEYSMNKVVKAVIYTMCFSLMICTFIASANYRENNDIVELEQRLSEQEKSESVKEVETKKEVKKVKAKAKITTTGTQLNIKNSIRGIKTTFIGDSVMLDAKQYILALFDDVYVDAKVSRQGWDLPNVIENINSNGAMKDVVVIHLGSNYKLDKKQFKECIKSLGKRKIFLINCVIPDAWEKEVNMQIKSIADEMDNVYMIDWYSYAKEKKEIFYSDATHPNVDGSKKYANFINKEMEKVLNNM